MLKKYSIKHKYSLLLMVVLISALSLLTYTKIPSNLPIIKDAKQNTTASYHLITKGFITNDGVTKSQFREPLPIAVLAFHMKYFTDIPHKSTSIEEITNTPKYIKQINIVNLYYIIPGFFAIWWLGWRLTNSHLITAVVISFSWSTFFVRAWHLGRPLSEYAACLILLIISITTIHYFDTKSKNKRYLIGLILGITIGLLSLTKASGFYVGLTIPLFLLAISHVASKENVKFCLKSLLITYVGIFLITLPWVARNSQIESNTSITSAIATRGGNVLLERANLNQVVGDDIVGAVYAFSPPLIQHFVFESHLGFQKKDLWFGGKYESLNRNVRFLKNQNKPELIQISASTDDSETTQAIKIISSAFAKHIKASIAFVWRGIWSFDGGNHLLPGGKTTFSILFNLVSFLALICFPFWAVYKKNIQWIGFSIFSFLLFIFYGLFSHFIPRYSAPLIPFAILSLALICLNYYQYLRELLLHKYRKTI